MLPGRLLDELRRCWRRFTFVRLYFHSDRGDSTFKDSWESWLLAVPPPPPAVFCGGSVLVLIAAPVLIASMPRTCRSADDSMPAAAAVAQARARKSPGPATGHWPYLVLR